MKVKFLKGIPASGKTTWAKKFCKNNRDWFRVNRDDIRNMRGEYWIPKDEKLITDIETNIVLSALSFGKNVIIDATNITEKYVSRMKANILKKFPDVTFQTKVFEISLEEAIKRDLERPNSVGEKVIRDFHKRLHPELYVEVKLEQDPDLPHIIICDIDGTIADKNDRSPFDWNNVINDTPRQTIIDLVESQSKLGKKIIFFTGRDGNENCYVQTYDWIKKYFSLDFEDWELYMRPENDNRKDSIVKKEMFDTHIRGKYHVDFILDDRDQVVKMWRNEIGLECLQVNWGNF